MQFPKRGSPSGPQVTTPQGYKRLQEPFLGVYLVPAREVTIRTLSIQISRCAVENSFRRLSLNGKKKPVPPPIPQQSARVTIYSSREQCSSTTAAHSSLSDHKYPAKRTKSVSTGYRIRDTEGYPAQEVWLGNKHGIQYSKFTLLESLAAAG